MPKKILCGLSHLCPLMFAILSEEYRRIAITYSLFAPGPCAYLRIRSARTRAQGDIPTDIIWYYLDVERVFTVHISFFPVAEGNFDSVCEVVTFLTASNIFAEQGDAHTLKWGHRTRTRRKRISSVPGSPGKWSSKCYPEWFHRSCEEVDVAALPR